MVTKVITSNDIDLNTLIIEDSKLKVNVANIVPAAKADKFLKEVRFEKPDFVFVVGSEEGNSPELRVPAADLISGLATLEALEEEKAKVVALEGKVGPLETSLAEEKAKVAEAEGKIASLEQEVETLKSKTPTAEEIAAVITADAVISAIIASIKGEEIKDLADTTKGYLIKQ